MIKPSITYKGPLGKKVKGFNAKLKQVLQDAIRLWHAGMLPHHFGTLAQVQARYPGVYEKRTAKYMRRKAKKYKHQRMLDFTGQTRIQVTRAIRISGTSKGASGRMTGANRGLNFRRTDQPDMRAELLTVNQQEADELARYVDAEMTKFLNDNSEVVTKQA